MLKIICLSSLWVASCGQVLAGGLPEGADSCLACHSDPAIAPDPRLAEFSQSAHQNISCESCHFGSQELPHSANVKKVQCEACHDSAAKGLKSTLHGATIQQRSGGVAAACQACHGHTHGVVTADQKASKIDRESQLETCGACHGDKNKVPKLIASKHPIESYQHSIHAQLVHEGKAAAACADCHGSHEILPAADPRSPIFHKSIPQACGRCHGEEAEKFKQSVHGKALAAGVREAPACTDCHGEHTIRSPKDKQSSVWRGSVTKTCSGCHASEKIMMKFGLPSDRVSTFQDSFHGLASKRGDMEVANCASCHGWHDILPSSDQVSRVNPGKLDMTCGQCHPGAQAVLSTGKIHASLAATATKGSLAGWVKWFYLWLIPLVIGGMFTHNFIDWLRKATSGKSSMHNPAYEGQLLLATERAQHALCAAAFIILAYTGFALKFSDAWWAQPLNLIANSEEARRFLHRAAAGVLTMVAVWHTFYIFFTANGRKRIKQMLPAKRDLTDPIHKVAYNLRLAAEHPELPRFSYIEKAEYWSLAWGTLVMLATGTALLFHNYALTHFPLWAIEVSRVIHYMEAILACLAIAVWHFYGVIFDPDIYPMNWAWLKGKRRFKD
ncbi:MAG: cytochrome b/b6 domain-containing protein [Elusimicrobiota bacterium]